MIIVLSTDCIKTYASLDFGLVGEGVLEVGYSSVHGSATQDTDESCITAMIKAAQRYIENHPVTDGDEEYWLQHLHGIAVEANAAYGDWLASNED